MIERKFIADKLNEFKIEEFVADNVKRVGHSCTKLQKTPLGEKIIIHTSRPGLIVGRKGQNIKKVTSALKKRFKLENPQLEISEVEQPYLDPRIVAENIANSLERFGPARFKGIGHKMMAEVMNAGAKGIEIVISGKIPSSRSKTWRFYQGFLKKCGEVSISGVKKAYVAAELKTGIIGIQVKIMPPDVRLPDDIIINQPSSEETKAEAKEKTESDKEEEKPKKETETKQDEEKSDSQPVPDEEPNEEKEDKKKVKSKDKQEKKDQEDKS